MMIWPWRVAVAAGVAAVLASCTAARVPEHPGEVAQLCGAACREWARCGAASEDAEASCVNACEEHGSKWRAYYREDYVAGMVRCLDGVECRGGREETAQRRACVEASRPVPTVKAKEVCSLIIERIRDCGHFLSKEPYDTDRCLRTVGLLDEGTLDAVAECTKFSCWNRRKYSPWECMRDLVDDDRMP